MRKTTLSVYLNSLFLLKVVLSATIDPGFIADEVKKYFDKKGIEHPSSKEKTVARELIYEREEHRQNTEREHDRAIKAETDKETLTKVLQFIKLRSVIEGSVTDHYPEGKPKKMSYLDAFNEMIVSRDIRFTKKQDLMVFRNMIETSTLGTQRTIQVVKLIYSKISDLATYKMEGLNTVKLPAHTEVEKITEILGCVMAPVHDDYITTVQLMLKARPLTPKEPTIPYLEELCCIRIETQSRGEEERLRKIKEEIKDEDVYSIFPRSKPKKIQHMYIPRKDVEDPQHIIMVQFDDVKQTRKAYDFNTGFLKDVLITIQVVSCKELSTTSESTTTTHPYTKPYTSGVVVSDHTSR